MRRKRNKIPSASVLNDLLNHCILLFWVTNGIIACSWLRKNGASKIISVYRLQWPSIPKITMRGRMRGKVLN
jgi:hypothetical protein